MTQRIFLALFALLACVSTGRADHADDPDGSAGGAGASSPRGIDLQIDPTPFFLHGFAPELGVSWGQHRAYVTAVAYDVPRFLREDKDFAERRNLIASAGYQYFVRRHLDGLFVGGSVAVTNATFSLASGGEEERTVNTVRVAARLGWMVAPLRVAPRLFFAPWISVGYSLAPASFAIAGTEIQRRSLGFTGALQLGWRF
jgi:hypothetical protein